MEIEEAKYSNIDEVLDVLSNRTILITGSTGLIGSNIIKFLFSYNKIKDRQFKVYALARSESKAKHIFGDLYNNSNLKILIGNVEKFPEIESNIDYIIHGANPTSSKYFIENPVEVHQTAIYGTDKILEFAKEKRVRGVVFLSTMEVYGTPNRGYTVCEQDSGSFDTSVIRNCYPLSKQICENLCCAYSKNKR